MFVIDYQVHCNKILFIKQGRVFEEGMQNLTFNLKFYFLNPKLQEHMRNFLPKRGIILTLPARLKRLNRSQFSTSVAGL